MSTEIITWIGIGFCLTQSATFSGLNIALFGISRLRLETEASIGNKKAIKVLKLRENSNFALTTILWGNVAFNTLLAILSNSIMIGLYAFIFSTFFITFFGEILPQGYFSRNAIKMSALLAPVFRIYQIILYPLAKPSSKILDLWLGQEGIRYFQEKSFREVIKRHIASPESDIDKIEGVGALNFLVFDDLSVSQEGEIINPESILHVPSKRGLPQFPEITESPDNDLLKSINLSGEKWVVLVNQLNKPYMVLDADGFLRHALFHWDTFNPLKFCHRPIIVRERSLELGKVVARLHVEPDFPEDVVIDKDIILIWGHEKKIITGADILGRLLHGIVSIKPGKSN